MKYAIEHF